MPSHIPVVIQRLFSRRIWTIATDRPQLFLTFDDGPHPRITPAVLDILRKHEAKGTFFCVGDRVRQFPDLYNRILQEGHAVGNHTQHHVNGWKTSLEEYRHDVAEASRYIDSSLFRPPYGRLTGKQHQAVSGLGMKTVMWTVLSGDYDHRLTADKVYHRVASVMQAGNIYVFHDSEKAERNMMGVLERFILLAKSRGFSFTGMVG